MNDAARQPSSIDEVAFAERLSDLLPDLRFAYLFGSTVRGEARPDSDLDLAVDAGRRLEPMELAELSGKLATSANRTVDVVDLQAAGPILKMQVLKHGELLVSPDDRARAEFAMYTPKLYEDWKHLRRPLDEAVIRRIES